MLCSICHKNVAVIFAKRIDGENSQMEGYCLECAKKKGINPIDTLVQQAGLTEEQMENMTAQFESMLGGLEELTPEDLDGIQSEQGANLGSIFSNMFGGRCLWN